MSTPGRLDFHPLRVKSVRPDTDEAVIVAFDVPGDLAERFRFTQGQHLTLRQTVAGAEQRRSYSICAGVEDGELRVGIRKVPGGVFSSWVNDDLKAGDTLHVMPPEGRFFVPLDPVAARHYLAIAGGSGITPILSIMKTVLAAEPLSRFTLIYGNRKQRSTMFMEEIEDLKNRYLSRLSLHLVFSQESVDLPLYSGRLSRAKIGEFMGTLVDPAAIDHVFVCGPHGVNDEAEAALMAAGIAPERIHIERFGVPVEGEAAAAARHVRRALAMPPTRRSSSFATESAARSSFTRHRATSSKPRPKPGSRCRSRASRACAAPAAPACSKARCAWSATSRSRSTRSRPASS